MAVRRLKIKGDVYRTGLLESFPIEYMKLRYSLDVHHTGHMYIYSGTSK